MSSLSHYKSMFVTALGTAGSRVLGLFRDQLIAFFFGTGGIAAAFIIAFQIPNLFRRLLGEGALTAALMPSLAQAEKKYGTSGAFRFLNQVICRVSPWMFIITFVCIVFSLAIFFLPDTTLGNLVDLFGEDRANIDRHRLAASLTALCMPYMPLICIAAVFSAALNLLGKFSVTALSAIWLNLSMIFSLGILGWLLGDTQEQRVYFLCAGALLGGVLQLGIPMFALYREGWRPHLNFAISREWILLKQMFLPAVIGAGINQINIFATRFLAFSLEEHALSIYYYANRIVEIPVGIFTVTVTTVIFPLLSRYAMANDEKELGATFSHGMRLILAINIPATVGIILLSPALIRLFFQYGEFSANDTALTIPVLCIFALSVPFLAISGIVGRAFNSIQETKFPTKVAGYSFLLNLIFAPLLGWFFGACGLATANLIAAIFQCLVLFFVLRKRNETFSLPIKKSLFQVLLASFLMAVWVSSSWYFLFNFIFNYSYFGLWVSLGIIVPIAVCIYFYSLRKVGFPECDELLNLFLRRKNRR